MEQSSEEGIGWFVTFVTQGHFRQKTPTISGQANIIEVRQKTIKFTGKSEAVIRRLWMAWCF